MTTPATKIAIAALSVTLLATIAGGFGLGSIAQNNCQSIELLKSSARASLERSLNSLPTIQYYKMHPKELEKALADNTELLKKFQASDCNYTPFGF